MFTTKIILWLQVFRNIALLQAFPNNPHPTNEIISIPFCRYAATISAVAESSKTICLPNNGNQ